MLAEEAERPESAGQPAKQALADWLRAAVMADARGVVVRALWPLVVRELLAFGRAIRLGGPPSRVRAPARAAAPRAPAPRSARSTPRSASNRRSSARRESTSAPSNRGKHTAAHRRRARSSRRQSPASAVQRGHFRWRGLANPAAASSTPNQIPAAGSPARSALARPPSRAAENRTPPGRGQSCAEARCPEELWPRGSR